MFMDYECVYPIYINIINKEIKKEMGEERLTVPFVEGATTLVDFGVMNRALTLDDVYIKSNLDKDLNPAQLIGSNNSVIAKLESIDLNNNTVTIVPVNSFMGVLGDLLKGNKLFANVICMYGKIELSPTETKEGDICVAIVLCVKTPKDEKYHNL